MYKCMSHLVKTQVFLCIFNPLSTFATDIDRVWKLCWTQFDNRVKRFSVGRESVVLRGVSTVCVCLPSQAANWKDYDDDGGVYNPQGYVFAPVSWFSNALM